MPIVTAGAVPVRLEALRALQAAADAGRSGRARSWPALCEAIVANTRLLGCGGVKPHASPQKRQAQRQQQLQRHQRSEGARWTEFQAQLSSSGAPDGRHNQDSMQSAPRPGVVCGQEANEQCGLQALRLLAAVLAHLSSCATPSQSDHPTANDSTSSIAFCAVAVGVRDIGAAAAVHADGCAVAATSAAWPAASGSVRKPSANSLCDARETQPEADSDVASTAATAWQDATVRVLPGAVASPSAQVRAAGVAAIAGLTPVVHERLPRVKREQLWRWAMEAARDEAATVRAAAAKAAAACAAIVVRPGSDAGGPFRLPSLQPAWPPCRCAYALSRSHLVGWLRGTLGLFVIPLQDGESWLRCSGSSWPTLRCP